MTSVGVQAEITDPEGILGVIRSFRSQLLEIRDVNETLVDLRKTRESSIQRTLSLSERLSDKIGDLLSGAQTMETLLHEDCDAISTCKRELEDLINENERLEHELGGHEVHVTEGDVQMEQRLNGFVEAELSQRLDDLVRINERLADAEKRYTQECEAMKAESSEFDVERSRLLGMLDYTNELTLARLVGQQTDKNDDSGRDLAKRLVDHHKNTLEHRQLSKEITDTQNVEQELECEIGRLVQQKKQLWKRCLDLENCLEQVQETEDEQIMLRPTAAYTDLPAVIEGHHHLQASSDTHVDEEEQVDHGRLLHRCHKTTHLSIDFAENEEEFTETEVINQNDAHSDLKQEQEDKPEVGPSNEENEKNDDNTPPVDESVEQVKRFVSTVINQETSTSHAGVSLIAKLRGRMKSASTPDPSRSSRFKLNAASSLRRLSPTNWRKRTR
ncbi:uncharacterized protein LOC128244467 [Mya arenaria]|uniref:uncharacterized protein LOC128244467 n=1 Tax=Mya arenaria TaxID=6604 RepID=UPI0022E56925|nr:uncharacterized protein LOC128244467 [Mya arenaria]